MVSQSLKCREKTAQQRVVVGKEMIEATRKETPPLHCYYEMNIIFQHPPLVVALAWIIAFGVKDTKTSSSTVVCICVDDFFAGMIKQTSGV